MNLGGTQSGLSLIVLVVVSIATRDIFADNGEIAIARPLHQITVDGDFADWPSSLPWYSIERTEFGASPQSSSDFDARFRVGYDRNSLYIAVEVRDDSTVTDGTRSWKSQDGCSVYLDIEHRGDDTGTIQYNIYGDGSPLFEAVGPQVATWSCQRSGSLHRYEWRFDTKPIRRPQVEFKPGRVVGLDISLCDKDEDASFSWVSWGAGVGKALSSARLGDVLLVSADDDTGKVRGRLVDNTGAELLHHGAVKLHGQNQTSPVTVMSNSRGEFEVVLPAGAYRAYTMSHDGVERFQVEAAGESRFVLHTRAPTAQATRAGSGTTVTAGNGTRIGPLHRYGTGDGMPGDERGLTQAADGSLWIAGWAGLARFDGRSITTFDEQDGTPALCRCVAIDDSGIVWVGTTTGLYRYDGKSFVRFTRAHGLPPGPVQQIIPDTDGSLWIRTFDGISRYARDSFTTIHETKSSTMALWSLAIESATRIWLGTSEGLVRLDAQDDVGEAGSWHETRFGTEAGLPGDAVRTLMIDSTGRLWIGLVGGLAQYDGATFKSWTKQDGLANETVVALAETEDRIIWVGTEAGLDKFSDGHFTHVADTEPVYDLYVDREQNIWIAEGSLFRFDSNRSTYPQPRSDTEILTARELMQTRDGALWVGTRQGLVQYKDAIAQRYSTEDGLVNGEVRCLLEDSRGGVWIGTNRGVSHFDGKQFASLTVHNGLTAAYATALAEDSSGRVWVGTTEGITLYDPQRGREAAGDKEDRDRADPNTAPLAGHISQLTTIDGLQSNNITSLLADADGAIWIGTGIGMCRWQENAVQWFDTPVEVNCLLQDDKKELYAGGDGLFHYDGTRWNRVATCGKARVLGLAQDAEGRIWMATHAGLKVYDGFAAQTFTKEDGMPESCWDVIWDDRENAVIVAGGRILKYRPRHSPLPVMITGVSADKEHASVAEVRFASAQPFLHFAFLGISFKTRPDAMLYRYRLRGFEDEWKLTENTQASYGRLPPGDYTFEVAAIDRDLSYSAKPASVLVHVDRPYGQIALWSSLACALIAVAVLSVGAIKNFTEQKRATEAMKRTERLVSIGTLAAGVAHELNNPVGAMVLTAEEALSGVETSAARQITEASLQRILSQARRCSEIVGRLLQFADQKPAPKSIQDLRTIVNTSVDLIHHRAGRSKIDFDISQEDGCYDVLANPTELAQVFVNLFANSIQASESGSAVKVSLSTSQKELSVVVEDRGCGIAPSDQGKIFDPFYTTRLHRDAVGLGLSISHGIIVDHGGIIRVSSQSGEGTRVTVRMPPAGVAHGTHDSHP